MREGREVWTEEDLHHSLSHPLPLYTKDKLKTVSIVQLLFRELLRRVTLFIFFLFFSSQEAKLQLRWLTLCSTCKHT